MAFLYQHSVSWCCSCIKIKFTDYDPAGSNRRRRQSSSLALCPMCLALPRPSGSPNSEAVRTEWVGEALAWWCALRRMLDAEEE